MEAFAKPLVRCRVLYIGSVSTESVVVDGFDSFQRPLSLRYKDEAQLEGIDSRLLVFSTGIQIQFVADPSEVIWFPISHLYACAGVKCVNYVNGATGRKERRFIPIDSITPELGDCSPPIFGFISKAKNNSVCHTFVCKSDQAILMLVQCCTSAYENRDVNRDRPLLDSLTLHPSGGFLANSNRFVSTFNVSNTNTQNANLYATLGAAKSANPNQYNWDTRSVATLPPKMKMVYAPQSVVNGGEEAIRQYFRSMETTTQKRARSQSPIGNTAPGRLGPPPPPPTQNGRAHSPPPDYDPIVPEIVTHDCPMCRRGVPLRTEPERDCPACSKTGPNAGPKMLKVKSNPIANLSEIDLPPVDYDYDDYDVLPKLDDVVRRRAESVYEESVKDQVILRENRGRRHDHLGGRLAHVYQNQNERAFGRSIGAENRVKSTVVGHGPSNVYEMNGVVGDRLFDDLQDTLGYYP